MTQILNLIAEFIVIRRGRFAAHKYRYAKVGDAKHTTHDADAMISAGADATTPERGAFAQVT